MKKNEKRDTRKNVETEEKKKGTNRRNGELKKCKMTNKRTKERRNEQMKRLRDPAKISGFRQRLKVSTNVTERC